MVTVQIKEDLVPKIENVIKQYGISFEDYVDLALRDALARTRAKKDAPLSEEDIRMIRKRFWRRFDDGLIR